MIRGHACTWQHWLTSLYTWSWESYHPPTPHHLVHLSSSERIQVSLAQKNRFDCLPSSGVKHSLSVLFHTCSSICYITNSFFLLSGVCQIELCVFTRKHFFSYFFLSACPARESLEFLKFCKHRLTLHMAELLPKGFLFAFPSYLDKMTLIKPLVVHCAKN